MIYVGRLAKAQAAWDVTHGTLAAEGTSPFFQPLERRGVCQAHNGHGYMYIYGSIPIVYNSNNYGLWYNGIYKSIYDYGYGSIPMKIPFLMG